MLKKLAVPSWVVIFLCTLALSPLEAVWGPPVTISGTVSSDPQIGVDTAGNSVAIWQEFDGVNTNIQAAILPIGGSWSTPVTISSSVGSNIDAIPQIAVDPAGNAVAVWEELTAGSSTVKAATLAFGGSWTTPVDISVPVSDSSQIPQVAVDSAGNAVDVWARFDGSNVIIQSASLPFGGSWTSPVDISTTGQDAFSPQVSLDSSGNAVAIWAGVGIGLDTIQAATLPFGGSWSASVTLSGTSAAGPQVAVDPAGNSVAVWTINIGADFFIQAATLPFAGSWSSAVNISTTGSSLFGAQVAVDLSGNAVAVWDKLVGSDIIVEAATLPFGGSWTSPVDISPTGAFAFDQQVAIDSFGNAIAVWDRDNGTDIVIQAAMLPFGGSWSAPVDLSTGGQTSDFPQIAINPSGYAVVDWTNETLQVIQSTTWIPAPTITNVAPNSGPTGGGTSVAITGTNFFDVVSVAFGVTDALFSVNSPVSITAIAPAEAAGTVDVLVTTTAGTSSITVNDHYTYVVAPPSPPSNFIGGIVHDTLESTWNASTSPNVTSYRIYKNLTLVRVVLATQPLVFNTHLVPRHSANQYSITAVNSSNLESTHLQIIIE